MLGWKLEKSYRGYSYYIKNILDSQITLRRKKPFLYFCGQMRNGFSNPPAIFILGDSWFLEPAVRKVL